MVYGCVAVGAAGGVVVFVVVVVVTALSASAAELLRRRDEREVLLARTAIVWPPASARSSTSNTAVLNDTAAGAPPDSEADDGDGGGACAAAVRCDAGGAGRRCVANSARRRAASLAAIRGATRGGHEIHSPRDVSSAWPPHATAGTVVTTASLTGGCGWKRAVGKRGVMSRRVAPCHERRDNQLFWLELFRPKSNERDGAGCADAGTIYLPFQRVALASPAMRTISQKRRQRAAIS